VCLSSRVLCKSAKIKICRSLLVRLNACRVTVGGFMPVTGEVCCLPVTILVFQRNFLTLMTEVNGICEAVVHLYVTTRCHVTEDGAFRYIRV
jgi:hypothetical protein